MRPLIKIKESYFLCSLTVSFASSKSAELVVNLPIGTIEAREMLDKIPEICRRSAFNHNAFS